LGRKEDASCRCINGVSRLFLGVQPSWLHERFSAKRSACDTNQGRSINSTQILTKRIFAPSVLIAGGKHPGGASPPGTPRRPRSQEALRVITPGKCFAHSALFCPFFSPSIFPLPSCLHAALGIKARHTAAPVTFQFPQPEVNPDVF
jgi:hypothetical protein